eukprot:6883458-Prymnesium_polylepis.1
MAQTLYPRHCVQFTWGAKAPAELESHEDDVMLQEGTAAHLDSRSAFYDYGKHRATALQAALARKGVSHVYLCGLAFDTAVAYTALHAVELGYTVTVVEDAVRGALPEAMLDMRGKLQRAGVAFVPSARLVEKHEACTPEDGESAE